MVDYSRWDRMDFDSDSDGDEDDTAGADASNQPYTTEQVARSTFWRNLYQESEIGRRAASSEGSRVPDDAEIVEHIDQLRKAVDPRHTGAEFFLGALSGRFGPGVDLGPKVSFLGGYIDSLYDDDVIGAYGADNVDWDAVESSLRHASLGERRAGSNGKNRGKQTIRYDNGDVYEGEVKGNKPYGEGVYRFANGNVYEGEFRYGIWHGKGTFSGTKGKMYEGEWKDGEKHGKGKQRGSDGSAYEGVYKDDVQHGKGTYKWDNGDVYEGEFQEGWMHGWGTMTYASGETYEGEWVKGKEQGKGTLKYPSGDIYEGIWTDGQQMQGRKTRATMDERKGADDAAPKARCEHLERKMRSQRSQQRRLRKDVAVKTCEHCGLDDIHYKLRACSGCNLALYCSAACQKAANRSHRRICEMKSELPPRDSDRLALTFDRDKLVDLDAGLRYATKYMDNLKHLEIILKNLGEDDTSVKLSVKQLSSLLRSNKGALESVIYSGPNVRTELQISQNATVWKELHDLKQLRLVFMTFYDAQNVRDIIHQQKNSLMVLCLPYLGPSWSKAKWRRTVALAVSACKNLVKLELDGCLLTDSDLKNMLSGLPNLRSLNLSRYPDDRHKFAEYAWEMRDASGDAYEFTEKTCGLIARKCPGLQELNLNFHNQLSVRGIRKIFEGCPRLRSFHTTALKLSCDDVQSLLEIAPQLLCLSLDDDLGIANEKLDAIIEATGGRTLLRLERFYGKNRFYAGHCLSAKTRSTYDRQVALVLEIWSKSEDPEVANEWGLLW